METVPTGITEDNPRYVKFLQDQRAWHYEQRHGKFHKLGRLATAERAFLDSIHHARCQLCYTKVPEENVQRFPRLLIFCHKLPCSEKVYPLLRDYSWSKRGVGVSRWIVRAQLGIKDGPLWGRVSPEESKTHLGIKDSEPWGRVQEKK